MKILQINTVSTVGSTGRIVAEICTAAQEKGYNTLTAYSYGEENSVLSGYKISTQASRRMSVLKCRLFGENVHLAKNDTKKLVKKIKEYAPDIVHLHNLHGYYLDFEILFDCLREIDVPVVWTLHDNYAFTGHCTYPERMDCKKYETLCHSCPAKKRYPKSLFFDTAKKSYLEKKRIFTSVPKLHVVTPSHWLGGCAKNSFLGKFPVTVINNGVNTQIFRPTESDVFDEIRKNHSFITISAAATWGKAKGYDILLEIAKKMPPYVHMVVVGVTKELKDSMPPNMTGVLKTNDAYELARLYSAADVFVNPTRNDTFSMVNVEAFSCGIPVITSDAGGTKETISPESGTVVKSEDCDAFCRAILSYAENAPSKEAVLKHAERFSSKVMTENYLNLYKEILNSEEK